LGSQLWGLQNFRIWFLGHGFRDLGSQLWDLDFTQGLHSGLRPRAPTSHSLCRLRTRRWWKCKMLYINSWYCSVTWQLTICNWWFQGLVIHDLKVSS
jgi:hypothetical protein